MKPYYEDGAVTIYHGDAREVALMVAPGTVLVTDPPYGVNFGGKVTKHTTNMGGYTTNDDPAIGPEIVALLLPLIKRAAVFSGIQNLMNYPKPRDIGCVYCPSGAGRGPWGFTCFNPILFYGSRPGTPQPTSIHSFATAQTNDVRGHPCPKPLRWLTWLVRLASEPTDVVLDPFAGTGTTLLAAKEVGRRAIGIEIEERYCEIAARRCSQEVLGLSA